MKAMDKKEYEAPEAMVFSCLPVNELLQTSLSTGLEDADPLDGGWK